MGIKDSAYCLSLAKARARQALQLHQALQQQNEHVRELRNLNDALEKNGIEIGEAGIRFERLTHPARRTIADTLPRLEESDGRNFFQSLREMHGIRAEAATDSGSFAKMVANLQLGLEFGQLVRGRLVIERNQGIKDALEATILSVPALFSSELDID